MELETISWGKFLADEKGNITKNKKQGKQTGAVGKAKERRPESTWESTIAKYLKRLESWKKEWPMNGKTVVFWYVKRNLHYAGKGKKDNDVDDVEYTI